jgi:pyruvate/2-oxoglutarate dehydrogenase complex dihydrolipoamide acyltransferase (E2) component
MTQLKKINIPNIGDFDSVEVIEVMVKVGDEIKEEDSLITVESDKASMDIPSPESGLVKSIDIKVGDVVKEGSLILSIEPLASDTPNESKKDPNKILKKHRLSLHLRVRKMMMNMMWLFSDLDRVVTLQHLEQLI